MSRLVVSDEPPLLVGQDPTAALQAEHHLILRILEIPHVDDGLVAAGGGQRSPLHHVCKLPARPARPAPRAAPPGPARPPPGFLRGAPPKLLPPPPLPPVGPDLAG